MRAIVWKEPGKVEIQEVPKPIPPESWALIKTIYGGICGSDITIKAGKHPRAKAPLILGHEMVGIVIQTNGNYQYTGTERSILAGDRVVVEPLLACKECRPCKTGNEHVCEKLQLLGVETDGGFAEFFIAPMERLYAVPDQVTDQQAALAEPLSVAVHAVNYGLPSPEKTAVILGAGPIGLLIGLVLRAKGIKEFWISEIDDQRLALAESLGFNTIDAKVGDTAETIKALTNGRGVDITFDAAGVPPVGMQIVQMTAILGRIIMVALHKKPCEVFFRQLSYSEQIIQGVRIYAKGDFSEAVSLLGDGYVDVSPLISHVFHFDNYQDAFLAAENSSTSCKVLIQH
ncbi:MAG: alcohol dehydrogenase catalytic domain-containing protein [Bacteroidetes bacterium]|nr:alcohol dehydrogenase catalytic domain-containing protein [Bacteroidota bacterium]